MLDCLDNALFRCDVASNAQGLAHSWLKNGFELLGDQALAAWLADDSTIAQVTERCSRVAADLEGFSPGFMLERIGPLRTLSIERREAVRRVLDESFMSQFDVQGHRLRILDGHQALMRTIDEFRRGRDGDVHGLLMNVRHAARQLRDVLQRLPRGYCLPVLPPMTDR